MQYLRTNTAVIVSVGPFLDKADGVTLETSLTITNERITLVAETDDGNAPTNVLDNVTGATSGTSNDLNYITGNDAAMMQLELSAANVNRLGRMRLVITDAANHCPVFHEYTVIPAAIYDALFSAGAGYGDIMVNTTIATLASQTSFTLTAGSADNDAYNGGILVCTDQTTNTQKCVGLVSDYTGSTKTITLAADPAVFTMATGDLIQIVAAPKQLPAILHGVAGGLLTSGTGTAQLSTSSGLVTPADGSITAAVIANGAIDAATFAADVDAEILSYIIDDATRIDASALNTASVTTVPAIVADTNELQTDWADGGRLDLILDARASQASVNTIDDFLDTEITAIMNRLPAALTADGNMKSDILRVVGIAIQAAGGGTSAVGEV